MRKEPELYGRNDKPHSQHLKFRVKDTSTLSQDFVDLTLSINRYIELHNKSDSSPKALYFGHNLNCSQVEATSFPVIKLEKYWPLCS